MIDMIQKICTPPRRDNPLEPAGKEKLEKDIEFQKIVKFLNAQKAVLDYAGLN